MINQHIRAIKELRDLTGLGHIQCKILLKRTNYDVKEAVKLALKEYSRSDKNKW